MQLAALLMDLDRSLGRFIAEHGVLVYAVLFAIVFCEMAFAPLFFLPGDPLLIVAGAYAAAGLIDAPVLAATLFVAALGGSLVGFAIGRSIGSVCGPTTTDGSTVRHSSARTPGSSATARPR